MTVFTFHSITWLVAVFILGTGAVLLAAGAGRYHRHRDGADDPFAMTRTMLPSLVVGQMVFLLTFSASFGVLAFFIVWGVTDHNVSSQPPVRQNSVRHLN